MVDIPIRRAQLIAPFGPGAMTVTKEGVSVICAGIDHWYKDNYGTYENIDIEHFKVNEWRLEKLLNVNHFRLPPDFRKTGQSKNNTNLYMNIPFLRFPQWHYCRFCGRLEKFNLHTRSNRLECATCKEKNHKNYLVQVPYVAMCEHGHLQDFPWREWVHRSSHPTCNKTMFLNSIGGSSLASMVVKCECGVEPRSLMRITSVNSNGTTHLSQHLDNDKDSVFTCQGKTPWLGSEKSQLCSNNLRATLRNASNVYFAKIKSSIYIPADKSKEVDEILEMFRSELFKPYLTIINRRQGSIDEQIEDMRVLANRELQPYTDNQIKDALNALNNELETIEEESENTNSEHRLRVEEYNVLENETDQHNLRIIKADMNKYEVNIRRDFSDIFLVEKLKETRVLAGFTRINSENGLSTEELKRLLRLNEQSDEDEHWLPAYEVYGEGIFLKLNKEKLFEWENSPQVLGRTKSLQDKADELFREGRMTYKNITPRFVMIHTLAHLIINQLTFECGYSTAALRERLYVSKSSEENMCGLLIYTAAGDSDGTLGGLVKMGKPGNLESILKKAIENARWCSADPICMEIGSHGGQGPDSSNLAACHNCGLLPETACEEFNRFLDRALIVGDLSSDNIGYFNL
ncbi:DrmB family protein [Fictibacillus nanhaiensis]|uniref:DrmB family protein n=1 Tax=Fictibacillus nanhaiensis TaxID=742169 RepID=UPI003C251111